MLDRLSLLTPGWTERSAADAGVALVELLAYAADNLSYRQDVIANEAYLNTARQRISVRRHARLVDYLLARGLQRAGVRALSARAKTRRTRCRRARALLTRAPGIDDASDRAGLRGRARRASCRRAGVRDRARAVIAALAQRARVLHLGRRGMLPAARCDLRHAQGTGRRTGARRLPRPRGTRESRPASRKRTQTARTGTSCASRGSSSARTLPAACSRTRRRTGRRRSRDRMGSERRAAIRALHLGARTAQGQRRAGQHRARRTRRDTAADGDRAQGAQGPPAVRAHAITTWASAAIHPSRYACRCDTGPRSARTPLTHGFTLADLLDPAPPGATGLLERSRAARAESRAMRCRRCWICAARCMAKTDQWTVRRDLLGSDDAARDFVVEVQDDGRARLRFGDDTQWPPARRGNRIQSHYRVGNGAAGNVGAEAIAHVLIGAGARDRNRSPIHCRHSAASMRRTSKWRAATRRRRSAPRSAR